MNELSIFNTLFGDVFDEAMRTQFTAHAPSVDVKENKDSYTLEMDLPGRSEEDVELELDRGVLTISSKKEETKETSSEDKAEKKNDKEEPKSKWLIRERRTSSFSRRFTLPDDIDAENVQATFKNGVLNVNIPRKALSAPKKIAIIA